MKDRYVNEGQKPFEIPEDVVEKGFNKDEVRKASKKYYYLTGLKTHTHPPCPQCGRKSCSDREACKRKADKIKEGRQVMGAMR